MAAGSFVPVAWGQVVTDGTQTLYFTDDDINPGGTLVSGCGTTRDYVLTAPVEDGSRRAYLNRALAEANELTKCATDFVYTHTNDSFAFQEGNVDVLFDLGCDFTIGALPPSPLMAVEVVLLVQPGQGPETEIASAADRLTIPFVCVSGSKHSVAVELAVDGDEVVAAGDKLIVRVDLRTVNTEPEIETYWYLDTNPETSHIEFDTDDVPECRDRVDNDGDGQIDFGTGPTNDPGCSSAQDDDETDETTDLPQCSDTLDNDGDGRIDFGTAASNDPGCTSAEDDDETDGGTDPQCSDGLDNDGDGQTDHPNDPGCVGPEDDDETDGGGAGDPECSDGVDNDGDGQTDHPADPGCASPTDDDETDGGTTPTEDAPRCDRDDPADREITRNIDEAFTLMAVCTDPDDDLDTGEWTVDDAPIGQEDLGPSPAEVDEEFIFEEPGTHVIEFTPTDEEGNVGTPASWVVHITDNSGEGEAPTCSRDEPTTFEMTRPAGTPFTLRASCTDPDDDLDHGTWIVDDDETSEDELGDSPALADEEFEFDDCATHLIHFVPTDEAGNVGSSATWRVTITECDNTNPTPTTPIPVFPSTIAMVLGVAGAMGGGFLILRRRSA